MMRTEWTQYYKIVIAGPKEGDADMDVTEWVDGGVRWSDEDGILEELVFEMSNGEIWLDTLAIGMRVSCIGGYVDEYRHIFSGYVEKLEPKFSDEGRITITVTASSKAGKKLALNLRDLVYPSPNHPKVWARGEVMASEIITNLAKDEGFEVGRVAIKKDIRYSLKKPVRQEKRSDWDFMQLLGEKIGAVVWYERRGEVDYIYIVDEEILVEELGEITFFYAGGRKGEVVLKSDKVVEMLGVNLRVDSKEGKKGDMKVTTDSKTGETTVETEQFSGGEWKRYRLDEEKVKRLPQGERTRLIELFMSGQLTWEGDEKGGVLGVKQFFKEIQTKDKASREEVPSSVTVRKIEGEPGEDGVRGKGKDEVKEVQYKTVLNKDAVKRLSPEERAALQGRIIRGEMTEEDRKLFTVERTVIDGGGVESVEEKKEVEKDAGGGESRSQKRKDRGMTVEVKIAGDLRVRTKRSYLLEGLGKYSRTYYCYKVEHVWGSEGFVTNITFTK